eukprot:31047-Pelagococcus_subviridis.AAC.2
MRTTARTRGMGGRSAKNVREGGKEEKRVCRTRERRRRRRGRTARAIERSIGFRSIGCESSAEKEEEEGTTTTTRDGRTRVRALVLRYRRDVRPLRAVAVGDALVLLGLGGRHRAATTDDGRGDQTR